MQSKLAVKTWPRAQTSPTRGEGLVVCFEFHVTNTSYTWNVR